MIETVVKRFVVPGNQWAEGGEGEGGGGGGGEEEREESGDSTPSTGEEKAIFSEEKQCLEEVE
jgi:hypothetical protein